MTELNVKVFMTIFSFIYSSCEEIENKYGLRLLIATVVFSVLVAFTPDEKTAYLMVGAYVAQEVVQSETGDKVIKVINKELDKFLVEDKPAKKE